MSYSDYLQGMEPRCSRCGSKDNLQRHHPIPRELQGHLDIHSLHPLRTIFDETEIVCQTCNHEEYLEYKRFFKTCMEYWSEIECRLPEIKEAAFQRPYCYCEVCQLVRWYLADYSEEFHGSLS